MKVGVLGLSVEDVLVDFFVKVRDACSEELERLKPEEISCYNAENVLWVRAKGQKGFYERYPAFQQMPTLSFDYNGLLADLKRHGGKMVRGGFSYWLWDDGQTVGRKPLKPK